MTKLQLICGLGLSLAALLTAGCGDDRPDVPFQQEQQVASSSPQPGPTPAAPAPAPPAASGNDPLVTPDQLAAGTGGTGGSGSDTIAPPAPNAGDALANDLPMPTAYKHWLTVAQYDAQVRLRVNGVGQGGFAASTTTDITMVMHPGSNTITMEYAPQSAEGWARVYVTRDPPLPQLMLFDSADVHTPADAEENFKMGAKPKPLTRTFTILVQ